MEVAEPGADQPHVVIERQPTDEDVPGLGPEGPGHGPDVGQQVGMGQHHALGRPGAARGVLQEGDVAGPDLGGHEKPPPRRQLVHRHHGVQGFHLRTQHPPEALGFRHGNQHGAKAIGDDAGVTPQVFPYLAWPPRGIDGNRHPAGHEDAEKAEEIIAAGGQHDDDRLSGLEVSGLQAGGHLLGAFLEAAKSDHLAQAAVAVKLDVGPVGMDPGVPFKDLDQRCGAQGNFPGRFDHHFSPIPGHGGVLRPTGGEDGAQKVTGRFGVGKDGLRQADAEGAFDPDQHLDPSQAVEAEVPVERAVQGHGRIRPLRMKFGRHLADGGQQPRRGRGLLSGIGAVFPAFPHAHRPLMSKTR